VVGFNSLHESSGDGAACSALYEHTQPPNTSTLPGVGRTEKCLRNTSARSTIVGSSSLTGVGESVASTGIGGDGVAPTGAQRGRVPRATTRREEHEIARLRRLGGQHRQHQH